MKNNLYNKGLIIEFDDKEQNMFRNKLNQNNARNNDIHTVIEDERLEQISYKYYGNSKLWWVIADFNDIDDSLINPFEDLVPGTKLLIPDIDQLDQIS